MMKKLVNDIVRRDTRIGSGDPLEPKQWYKSDTYYQILYVEPPSETDETEKRRKNENITTNILARKRGKGKIDDM